MQLQILIEELLVIIQFLVVQLLQVVEVEVLMLMVSQVQE